LPGRPAVGVYSWNYRELIERTTRIGGALRARGLENCAEFFELLFGCWAAGLCAVPANARLHPREVEYIAANSGARLLTARWCYPRSASA
jgi:acyl-CoA synthetase (AMP-forming)/AMP-acid ligase II